MTQAIEWVTYRGMPLYDEDGNLIGIIEEFYVEADDAAPAWVVVVVDDAADSADGADGDATRSYVPMRDARRADDGRGLQVAVNGDTVREAPGAQGAELSGDEERRLYEHYGQTYPGGDTSADADASDTSDGGSRKPGLLQRLLGRV